MSVAQGIQLHPHHQAFASLRTHLLRSRRMLLMQVVSRPVPQVEQGLPTDVLGLLSHSGTLSAPSAACSTPHTASAIAAERTALCRDYAHNLMRRSVSHASNCLKNGLRYDARHGGPTPPQKRFTDPESRLPIGS